MSESSSYGFGGKLIAAVVFALLCGYLWACVEEGRSPLAILKIFSGKEEPEIAKAPPIPAAPPKKPLDLPSKKVDAPKPPEQPSKKIDFTPPPPSGPKMYSAVDMSILFNETDDLLRRGKLFEARDKVKNTSRLMIPQDALTQFSDYEARVGRYHSLLLETTKGGTVEMPKMTQVLIKDGGKLIVKVIHQDKDAITYETLTGIRSRIDKARCEEIKDLEPVYGRVEVSLELKKQADYKGLVVEQEPGKPLTLKNKAGRTPTSLQIFDLADFCARNGANDKLVPLFDEALARDADLLNTVHESKAERMVEVLVYFLTIKATYDAKKTLEILKERYVDTKAYKERVSGDSEFMMAMEGVLNRRPSGPIAKLDKPAEKATPVPVPPPSEKPAPTPNPDLPPTPDLPPPAKPADPTEAPIRVTDPGTPAEVTSVGMPDGTNEKISGLVARGDRYFKEAMEHLNNCDPRIKPETAGEENKKALKLFLQAIAEGYDPAQNEYKGGSRVPEPLLDRFREAQQRAYFCRKFAVSMRK